MINAVNVPVQVIAVNQLIPFVATRFHCGCSARHEEGSGRFVLVKPGIYLVSFNTTFSTDAAGEADIALEVNGEPIAGARIQETTAAATLYTSGFTTPVRVYCNGNATVTINNLSTVPVSVSNTNIVIHRICG